MSKFSEKKLASYCYNFGEEYVEEKKRKTVSAIDCMESYQALRKYFEHINRKPSYVLRRVLP